MNFRRCTLSALLVYAFASGCASTTETLTMKVTRPAELNMKSYDRFAMGEINSGQKKKGGFLSKLSAFDNWLDGKESRKDWTEKLAVTLRSELSTRFRPEDDRSDSLAGTFIVSGSVLTYDWSEEVSSKMRERSAGKGKKKLIVTYYREGTAYAEVHLKIEDAKTSAVLLDRIFREARRTTKRDTIKGNVSISRDETRALFSKVREDVVSALARMVMPYTDYVYVAFELHKEIPELKRAFQMAKVDNWEMAIEAFKGITQTYANHAEVHRAYYNLGMSYVCLERFEEARAPLTEALERLPASSKYVDAIENLDVRIGQKERLKEQQLPSEGTL